MTFSNTLTASKPEHDAQGEEIGALDLKAWLYDSELAEQQALDLGLKLAMALAAFNFVTTVFAIKLTKTR